MELLAGFVFGFVGSLHCIGMCGPIVLALPIGNQNFLRFLSGRILYNLGRVVTYCVMGGIFGLLGTGISLALLQQNLSILAGATILIVFLLQHGTRLSLPSAASIGLPLAKIQNGIALLLKESSPAPLFVLGLLNGLLPCGFVYLAVATAAVTADVTRGVMFMAGFGLGTIPAMAGFGFFPRAFSSAVRAKISRVLPTFTLLVGVLLILRGLNLGIPFVSPKLGGSDPSGMMHNHH